MSWDSPGKTLLDREVRENLEMSAYKHPNERPTNQLPSRFVFVGLEGGICSLSSCNMYSFLSVEL